MSPGRGRGPAVEAIPSGMAATKRKQPPARRAKRSLLASRPALPVPKLELQPHQVDIVGLALVAIGVFLAGVAYLRMVRGRARQRFCARGQVRVRPPRLRDSGRAGGRWRTRADARAAAAGPPAAHRRDLSDGRDHAGARGGHAWRRTRPDPDRRVLASGGVRVARRRRRPGRAVGLLAPAVDGGRGHPRRVPVPRGRDPRLRRDPGRRDPRHRRRRSRDLRAFSGPRGISPRPSRGAPQPRPAGPKRPGRERRRERRASSRPRWPMSRRRPQASRSRIPSRCSRQSPTPPSS